MASQAYTDQLSDLIEHFHLDAQCHESFTLITSPVPGRRNAKVQDQWDRKKRLGQGAFGLVWLEQHQDTKALRAVKELQKDPVSRQDFRKAYAHELYALAKFSKFTDHFADFYGWYDTDDSVFLSMEYFPHGDLAKHMHKPFPEAEARDIISQLVSGLEIIHKHNITHRDLKPQNVFVVEKSPAWWVKIGDFGVSKRFSETSALQTVVGTALFMAPEIADDDTDEAYTNAVDIWSLGCIAYVLLCFDYPFSNLRDLRRYARGKIPLSIEPLRSQDVSVTGIVFVKLLLSVSGHDRPSVRDMAKHEWLKDLSVIEQSKSHQVDFQNNLRDVERLRQQPPSQYQFRPMATFSLNQAGLDPASLNNSTPPASSKSRTSDMPARPTTPKDLMIQFRDSCLQLLDHEQHPEGLSPAEVQDKWANLSESSRVDWKLRYRRQMVLYRKALADFNRTQGHMTNQTSQIPEPAHDGEYVIPIPQSDLDLTSVPAAAGKDYDDKLSTNIGESEVYMLGYKPLQGSRILQRAEHLSNVTEGMVLVRIITRDTFRGYTGRGLFETDPDNDKDSKAIHYWVPPWTKFQQVRDTLSRNRVLGYGDVIRLWPLTFITAVKWELQNPCQNYEDFIIDPSSSTNRVYLWAEELPVHYIGNTLYDTGHWRLVFLKRYDDDDYPPITGISNIYINSQEVLDEVKTTLMYASAGKEMSNTLLFSEQELDKRLYGKKGEVQFGYERTEDIKHGAIFCNEQFDSRPVKREILAEF